MSFQISTSVAIILLVRCLILWDAYALDSETFDNNSLGSKICPNENATSYEGRSFKDICRSIATRVKETNIDVANYFNYVSGSCQNLVMRFDDKPQEVRMLLRCILGQLTEACVSAPLQGGERNGHVALYNTVYKDGELSCQYSDDISV